MLETRGNYVFKGALKDPSLPLLPFSGSSLKPACVCHHSWYKAIVEHPLLGSLTARINEMLLYIQAWPLQHYIKTINQVSQAQR